MMADDALLERDPALGRALWRMLPFVRPYRKRVLLGLVANGLARACDLLPMLIVGRVVDLVTAGRPGAERELLLLGLAVLATFMGLAVFQSASDYALDTMAQMARHDLRVTLYEHLQRLDASFFESRQTGDVMAVLSADVDALETFFADVSTSVVRLVITFVGTYGVLAWLDWRLAALLFIPLPAAVLAVRFYAVRVQPRYRQARQAVGDVNAAIENGVQGMGVIQAYTAENQQAGRIRDRSAEYRDASVAAARQRALFIPVIYCIAGLAFAALIAGGGWLTLAGRGPSLGDYATFVLLAMRLVLPLFVFGMIINQIQRSEASARRIAELLDTEPRVKDEPGAVALARSPEAVELRDVQFAYHDRPPALRGVDLRLERGRTLGVVGPTGAGKSTLVKLLLRYHDPLSGEILVDGRSLRELTLESWRHKIGYVSQDAFLFFGSVAENIALGSPGASRADIERAAAVAGADDFIRRLPQGYDTAVGERGVRLSGGQRQRVSLARAILRDPPLLVLDEATSAVDTRTEEIIQRGLSSLRTGRMTLAVAHRLSTIRHSDEIVVVVDGRIAERGTHESLLAAGGVYAGLWNVQSGEAAAGAGEMRGEGAFEN